MNSAPNVRDPNLETALAYLQALQELRAPADLARFFHDQIVQEEFPSRLVPGGAAHDRASLLARAARAPELLAWHRYELRGALTAGSSVALELEWRGALAQSFGPLCAGQELRAQVALFLEFRDGLIVRQRNYDCYYPF